MAHPPAQTQQVSQLPLPPKRYYQTTTHPPPPRPPATNESYNMFGRAYTTNDALPSLEDAGRKRLYDPVAPPCDELRRMNRDLLDHFLSLVKELCQPMTADSGEKPREIIATIEDTFVNMQHLVNVMRPAQAAMDLKTLLDRQTKARQEMSEKLKDSVRKAWELIGEAATKLSEPSVELSEEAQVSVEELEKADLETQETEREHTPEKKTTPQHEQSDERSMDTVLAEIAQIVNDPTL